MRCVNKRYFKRIIYSGLLSLLVCIFGSSRTLCQVNRGQVEDIQMPEAYLLNYNVAINFLLSKDDIRRDYEQALASETKIHEKNKNSVISLPVKFKDSIPDRKFQIEFSQSHNAFYWNSNEKIAAATFIFDGKRSYYYEEYSHRMYVRRGFSIQNGMTLPLPGKSLLNIPLIKHSSSSSPGHFTGDVYSGNFNDHDTPLLLPGSIELNSNPLFSVKSSVSFTNKKFHEYFFDNYVTLEGMSIPKNIREVMYKQQSYKQKTKVEEDLPFIKVKYNLVNASVSAAPPEKFIPENLLHREKAVKNPTPEFVQWYYDDGREITFYYKPGKTIEEQAEIADYEEKKDKSRVENGKIDPRNYAGLGLLAVLLAAIGWKTASVLKARLNS